jgi:hypothetical protein
MRMLTDDPLVLTGILMVAMIPLYILILRKLRPSQALGRTRGVSNSERHYPKTRKRNNVAWKKAEKNAQLEKPKHQCAHSFGYLSSLPRNASVASECLGCPQIIECLTYSQ